MTRFARSDRALCSRRGRRKLLKLSLWLAFALSVPRVSHAQMGHTAPNLQAPSLVAPSLRHRLGVDVAEALLKSQDPEDRQRGFERLSSVGTPQALDALLQVFEPGGAARSARDRLVAVRALAPHARLPAVRELLVRVMVGVGSNPERPEAIDGLIEHAAALALAASGDDGALSALGKAVRQPGHVADTARDALLAFPPRNLQLIVQSRNSATKALVSLLSELGDPRAVPTLRDIVRSAAPDVRAEAAVALAKLGVGETVELARHWLSHEPAAELRLASARILIEFRTSDAGSAVRRLLLDESTRSAAIELANAASLPDVVPTLEQLSRSAEGDERSALLAALGLAGTREAFSFLGGALSARETSSAAALALALAPGNDAEAALSRALGAPSTRRAAVRASIARQVALGRTPAGLQDALKALAATRDPADSSVFFQASAVLAPDRIARLAERASRFEMRALARAALVSEAAAPLAARLVSETDAEQRTALAACLASPAAAELVPTDVLLTLLDARGLAAPLAARALAARDSPTLRPKVLALLASEDALLRSHTALGLGSSEESSALGVLERAYRFETDDNVRLALVQALGARREMARQRVLQLARTLDASRAVRDAAALALSGAEPSSRSSGPQSAWLDFSTLGGESGSSPAGAASHSTAAALVITASGLALPAFADPDGILLLPALPVGPLTLRLAAPTGTEDAAQRKPP
ncbi:MAG TPA: HEAT repeat domain-containing protein [Polyangiaceae bacterium]|jgi:HEAT repeat protein|nr:HEAT repeat domain-containing protein [Polyangiaceae bacterium]